MSYDNPRIGLDDTVQDIMIKMAGGNPGALTVLVEIYKKSAAIDPDDAFGGLGPILDLDSRDIYEDKIWMFYKDVCGQNLESMLMLLRACQLGYLPESELVNNVKNSTPFTTDRFNELNAKVREYLPFFGSRA